MNAPELLTLEYGKPHQLEPVLELLAGMLSQLKRDLVVAVNGAGINAGKTYVTGALRRSMTIRGVPSAQISTLGLYAGNVGLVEKHLSMEKEMLGTGRPGVLILDAAGDNVSGPKDADPDVVTLFRALTDQQLTAITRGLRDRVDLWLGIESHLQPFWGDRVLADVRIRNEGARKKR